MKASQSVQQLVIVSGMGGSGKTQALHTLEDIGFYCMDNLPIVLLPHFLDMLCNYEEIQRVAVGVDVRDRLFLDKAPGVIEELLKNGTHLEILFLDANDDILLQRYKETRRVHPLVQNGDIAGAIAEERRRLTTIQHYAHHIVDTSEMTVHDLRRCIQKRYSDQCDRMDVTIISFGYKYGLVKDADIVFDVRFLKNPFFVPELKNKTGKDPEVSQYVFTDPDSEVLLGKFVDILNFLLPRYRREGKRYLTIAIGCTGGQHRSVAMVEALYKALNWENGTLRIVHRDCEKSL